jgi:hypothetical protein
MKEHPGPDFEMYRKLSIFEVRFSDGLQTHRPRNCEEAVQTLAFRMSPPVGLMVIRTLSFQVFPQLTLKVVRTVNLVVL